MIKKEKLDALKKRMQNLNIFEKDLEEKFLLGSGKGGQNINKTHSCVYLKHLPTNLEVKTQKARSREDNRYFARKLLCEKIEDVSLGEKSPQHKKAQKIQKQKKRRSRRVQKKIEKT